MTRRPPRSTLFPYTDALPIYLKTQEVRTETSFELVDHIPENCIAVSESGICTHGELRSEEHTSELQSHSDLVCRLLLEKKKKKKNNKHRSDRIETRSVRT